MNVVRTVFTSGKVITRLLAGIGASQISSNICKAYTPADASKFNSICLKLGVLSISSAVSAAVGKVVDDEFDQLEDLYYELKAIKDGESTMLDFINPTDEVIIIDESEAEEIEEEIEGKEAENVGHKDEISSK